MLRYHFFNILIILLLISICLLYFYNLDGWLIHDDEGGYLYQAWRMTEGEIPYRDFYTPEGPLFLFLGYLIFKLFGVSVYWLRFSAAIFTILSGYLIFLIGRKTYNFKTALFSSIFYLVLPIVYFQARIYRSDAYAVFFSLLGLVLFLEAWQDKKITLFILAGLFFSVACYFKLLAILGVFALLTFILCEALIEKNLLVIHNLFLPFISGFLITTALIFIIIFMVSPFFLNCIVGYHIDQPSLVNSSIVNTIFNNIKDFFMLEHLEHRKPAMHFWLIIISLPLLIKYIFTDKYGTKRIMGFCAVSFFLLFLSPYRDISRYALFFLPVAILTFTDTTFSLVKNRHLFFKITGLIILLLSLFFIFIPGLVRNFAFSEARESGAVLFAEFIKKNTDLDDYVVSDYGDTIFYARRKSTPLMSGISEAAVLRGGITVKKAIAELENYRVKMVLIHKRGGIPKNLTLIFGTPFGPHHIISLIKSKEGPEFLDYLDKHYILKGSFNRIGQIFDVYYRKD